MNEPLGVMMRREYPGVIWCESAVGCKRRWSVNAHYIGRLDQIGVIHLSGLDRTARNRRLWNTLRLVYLAQNRPMRTAPEDEKVYQSCSWATAELKRRFHHQTKWWWSAKDRKKVLKSRSWLIATWARYGDRPQATPIPPKKRSGVVRLPADSNPNAKLNWETVHQIRADREAGLSMMKLARKYNISATQVNNIVHRQAWK